MIYTDEFKGNALKMAEKLGIRRASKELHVGAQTLYSWRKKEMRSGNSVEVRLEPEGTSENNIEEQKQKQMQNLQKELQEQRKLNKTCQQTIEYLVEENTALRQQCESYLKAISLIVQR